MLLLALQVDLADLIRTVVMILYYCSRLKLHAQNSFRTHKNQIIEGLSGRRGQSLKLGPDNVGWWFTQTSVSCDMCLTAPGYIAIFKILYDFSESQVLSLHLYLEVEAAAAAISDNAWINHIGKCLH